MVTYNEKYAIVVEGKSDKALIELLIEKTKILDINRIDINRIEFYIMGGKSNLLNHKHQNYKELSQKFETGKITKALFILDADSIVSDKQSGGEKTTGAISETLRKLKLDQNSDFYISCNPETKEGCLESLLLSTIPPKQSDCIQTFLTCSDFRSKDNSKVILNQIYRKAYPDEPCYFSHKNFRVLKEKLTALVSGK